MKFTFHKMKREDAHQIAAWHYEAPYDFYDADQDPEDLAELLNPQSWQESYYSVFNEENELVGLFVFKKNSQTVEVGLGRRQLGVALLNGVTREPCVHAKQQKKPAQDQGTAMPHGWASGEAISSVPEV